MVVYSHKRISNTQIYSKHGDLQLHQVCRHSSSFIETQPIQVFLCYCFAFKACVVLNTSEALDVSKALYKHQLIRDC